jgi:predicted PurR-regulated permease PerM
LVRVLLQIVLPFLAPFVLFYAYRLLVTRGQHMLRSTPWFALLVTGLVLVCASIASLAFIGGHEPQGTYVPPHLEDGRVVPGTVRPPAGGDG